MGKILDFKVYNNMLMYTKRTFRGTEEIGILFARPNRNNLSKFIDKCAELLRRGLISYFSIEVNLIGKIIERNYIINLSGKTRNELYLKYKIIVKELSEDIFFLSGDPLVKTYFSPLGINNVFNKNFYFRHAGKYFMLFSADDKKKTGIYTLYFIDLNNVKDSGFLCYIKDILYTREIEGSIVTTTTYNNNTFGSSIYILLRSNDVKEANEREKLLRKALNIKGDSFKPYELGKILRRIYSIYQYKLNTPIIKLLELNNHPAKTENKYLNHVNRSLSEFYGEKINDNNLSQKPEIRNLKEPLTKKITNKQSKIDKEERMDILTLKDILIGNGFVPITINKQYGFIILENKIATIIFDTITAQKVNTLKYLMGKSLKKIVLLFSNKLTYTLFMEKIGIENKNWKRIKLIYGIESLLKYLKYPLQNQVRTIEVSD